MTDPRPACSWCNEPILPGELIAPMTPYTHRECGLRAVAGGLNHQLGQCTCCGGTLPPDPVKLTRHQAARLACVAFEILHP